MVSQRRDIADAADDLEKAGCGSSHHKADNLAGQYPELQDSRSFNGETRRMSDDSFV
ncbi:hypothetical protein FKW77_000522 [Venturia effusa]|uniref:Uncharacterized protein n=1 Tax=Venturia effusa TaxID=50376 RepID=A0A517L4T5_9PEZI|nr:hypothetical protein FKW77_000522 [Venturia effusa]